MPMAQHAPSEYGYNFRRPFIKELHRLLSSRDAYMLIYARRDDSKRANTWPLDPPPEALEIIVQANEAHEKVCAEYDAKYVNLTMLSAPF